MQLYLNHLWIKNGLLAEEVSISLSTWVHETSSVVFAAMGELEARDYSFMPCSRDFSISVGSHRAYPTAHTLTPERPVCPKLRFLRPALRTLNCCLRL
ncbi:MAG: hypothetical protein AB7F40_06090 [Victivallaceae bacterium]|nr:hypothetical protein [Victivallaceae bacterium]